MFHFRTGAKALSGLVTLAAIELARLRERLLWLKSTDCCQTSYRRGGAAAVHLQRTDAGFEAPDPVYSTAYSTDRTV